MDSAFALSRVGLLADFSRLSVESQNLSNVDTVGYKRQVPFVTAFDARLERVEQAAGASLNSTTTTDLRPGALKETGRTLDLALDGDGFFSVRTASGVLYTRRGDFTVDGTGRLVDADGNAVLGGGGEITLPGTAISIDRDGVISDGERQVGRIDVVQFAQPQQLEYVGASRFDAGGQTAATDRSATRVRSGFLEASNVQPAHEMIGLLEVSRQVEFARNVLTARDEMLDSAANTLAQF